jgi:hypothetical protein
MPLPDVFASYELIFRPASDPPDDDVTVLASDGKEVNFGIYAAGEWFKAATDYGEPEFWDGVIGWADLPDAEECIGDLL